MVNKKDEFYIEGNNFGERLRNLRICRKLSQNSLAKKIGYKTSGSISKIENNITPPDIETLSKIAVILNADLHWLITGKTTPALMSVAERFVYLTERLAPYMTFYLQHLLPERANLTVKRNDLLKRQSQVKSTKKDIDEINRKIKEHNDDYNRVIEDLNLLKESPFCGDSYEY